jgi:cobalamin biosynthesis Mg chelatase CobN
MSATLRVWFVIALALSAGLAHAADKVALLSTSFVLERKFKLMEEAARLQGVELAWTQVDRAEPAGGEAGARRALQGARLVILDSPRSDDQAQIERVAGKLLREAGLPTVGVQVMSPPQRLRAMQMDAAQAQRLFDYYVGGTRANHERLASYLKAWLTGGDLAAVPPPIELPNGGIYHPGYEQAVFASLPQYLAWWQRKPAGIGRASPWWRWRPAAATSAMARPACWTRPWQRWRNRAPYPSSSTGLHVSSVPASTRLRPRRLAPPPPVAARPGRAAPSRRRPKPAPASPTPRPRAAWPSTNR